MFPLQIRGYIGLMHIHKLPHSENVPVIYNHHHITALCTMPTIYSGDLAASDYMGTPKVIVPDGSLFARNG